MAQPDDPTVKPPAAARPEAQRELSLRPVNAQLTAETLAGGPSRPCEPARLRPGDVFAGRYEILSYLGRGGFSYVFRALDRTSGEQVALKFLSARDAGGDFVMRMRRELRLARDLRHPNIVRVYELLEAEDLYCLSMEFVSGRTLKEVVASGAPLPIAEAHRLLVQLVSAMAAVHAAGVIHRDLKPQNVVVTDAGEVKLLDFGLAKTPDSTGLTVTGTILGTPDYMSPEQVQGKTADTRSDVYSLGIIAYELFVGRPPYTGDTPLAIALQHVHSRISDPVRQRPDMLASHSQLILRMTATQPSRRPGSAQEVLVDLSARPGAKAAGSGKRPVVAAAVAVAVIGAGIAGVTVVRARQAAAVASAAARGGISLAIGFGSTSDLAGGDQFLRALASDVERRLKSPVVRIQLLEEGALRGSRVDFEVAAAQRADELLRLALVPELVDGRLAYRVELVVAAVATQGPWRVLASYPVRALDFQAVDAGAGEVARRYAARLAELGIETAARGPGAR